MGCEGSWGKKISAQRRQSRSAMTPLLDLNLEMSINPGSLQGFTAQRFIQKNQKGIYGVTGNINMSEVSHLVDAVCKIEFGGKDFKVR